MLQWRGVRGDGHEFGGNTNQRSALSGKRGYDCNGFSAVDSERGDDRDERRADHDMRGKNHRERGRKRDAFYQALRSKSANGWIERIIQLPVCRAIATN